MLLFTTFTPAPTPAEVPVPDAPEVSPFAVMVMSCFNPFRSVPPAVLAVSVMYIVYTLYSCPVASSVIFLEVMEESFGLNPKLDGSLNSSL